MGDIREMIIKELAKRMADTGMESADKIVFGQAYGVPNWLLAGYKELAERGTPISRTEGQKLGGNTVAGLCQVREAAKERKRSRATFGQPQYEDIYDYEAHIRREFAQELGNAGMPASAGTRLLSTDNSAHVPLNFIPVRNEKFYMENIVFLVRCCLVLEYVLTISFFCLGRKHIVQDTTNLFRPLRDLRDYLHPPVGGECAGGRLGR
jgi:hypothetical protein